jgi:hypothetical protein
LETAGACPASRVPGSRQLTSFHAGLWLAGFLLLCFTYFLPRPADWEQSARLDTTLALVDHGSFAIDAYRYNTGDLANSQGHFYSNKAPGLSLAGVPAYLVFKGMTRRPVAPSAGGTRGLAQRGALLYLESIVTVAIPATLLLVLFFWFLGYFSESITNRVILTAALGLGTSIFPFARVFFSHAATTAFLFAGFVLVWLLSERNRLSASPRPRLLARPRVSSALAGFSLGCAVLLDYPAALVALLIAVYAVLSLPRSLWWCLLAGTLPGLGAILAYDLAIYGNPLVTGYHSTTTAWGTFGSAHHYHNAAGVAGFSWPPHAAALWGLSFSPYRGLFFVSPFLLLAFPGFLLAVRRAKQECILFLAISVAVFVTMSMFGGWDGGDAVGPRYLIMTLPFLAFPVIFVLDYSAVSRGRFVVYPLIGLSCAVVWMETLAGGNFPPSHVANPLFTYSLPALAHGDVRFNLTSAVLTVLHVNKLGQASLLTVVPLFVVLASWSFLCLPLSRGWTRHAISSGGSLALRVAGRGSRE